MYSRSTIRQPPTSRTMSSVPSVEPESATSTSSATRWAERMQGRMFFRSFLQGMMTVRRAFMALFRLSSRGAAETARRGDLRTASTGANRLAAGHAGQDVRGGNAVDQVGHANRAAVGLDDLMAHDLLARIGAAFDQHVGTNGLEQRVRRVFVEHDHVAARRPAPRAWPRDPLRRSPAAPGPLSRRTLASLLTPTNSTSPSAAASDRYCTCPTCSRSKQPLVNTTRSPRRRCSAASDAACAQRDDLAASVCREALANSATISSR